MRASMGLCAWLVGLGTVWASSAAAQYPPLQLQAQPPPQPYPPTYSPQPPPAQPPQAYPPLPPSPYGQPPPAYGPPAAPVYPQPLPAPYGRPEPVLQPPPPPRSRVRGFDEMMYLYGVGAAYGVGTGVWIDALGKLNDPGLAVLAPLVLGAAVPIGAYLWDTAEPFDRGVPSSIATGLLLGGIEGVAIDGLQWQLTGNGGPNTWDFRTWTTITFAAATVGGIGGYVFGEWTQPDPRSLALIASGSGWGALTGILFGAGVVNGDWRDGSAVWGFAGYNLGLLAAGAVSTSYVVSYQTLKYMWAGQILGVLATSPIYLFYISDSTNIRHGLIANAVGGLAGLALAGLLTAGMRDPPGAAEFTPPFQLALAPAPPSPALPAARGGTELTVYGQF